MSIKKRLFISNILMLVVPIVLTALTSGCMLIVFMRITGAQNISNFHDGFVFLSMTKRVDEIRTRTDPSDMARIASEIDAFNEQYRRNGLELAFFRENELVYPTSFVPNPTVHFMLERGGGYLHIEGTEAVYGSRLGDCTFILASSSFSPLRGEASFRGTYTGILALAFALMLAIIFSVNRALTWFVTKKITAPIEMLVSSVHELRDGNLEHRIAYSYNDEFKSVCDDFNEMAQRLHDMVSARQRDESSRKELIAGISHDLRTPLTSIKAYVEGIQKRVASTPELQERYIDTIKRKAEEMERILNQLFLFSKLDIGEFPFLVEPVGINRELKGFLSEMSGELESWCLEVELSPSESELYADIDIIQFRNVLHNILNNTAKYKTREKARSSISVIDTGQEISITLADDGPGVAEGTIDKLFDVFYRADLSRNGTSGSGLGLAIARKIIERLGGTIGAKNSPDGGLTIEITLPKSKQEQ